MTANDWRQQCLWSLTIQPPGVLDWGRVPAARLPALLQRHRFPLRHAQLNTVLVPHPHGDTQPSGYTHAP